MSAGCVTGDRWYIGGSRCYTLCHERRARTHVQAIYKSMYVPGTRYILSFEHRCTIIHTHIISYHMLC